MSYMDMFSLKGKVALVTGGSYGIGFAIARAYARAGARIAFNCRSQEHLDTAMAAYAKEGIDAKGYICDVTDTEKVRDMVADIDASIGTIDILVNNAGIIKRIPMCDMDEADFRQVIDIDLVAPFIVSKAVIPGMIAKGEGKIINICSMMSELGRETVSAYAAAKGGLKMLTRNVISARNLVEPISSAMASDRATLQRPRPLRSASVRLMDPVILSMRSLSPRRQPAAGGLRKIWKDRLFSWHLMLPIL